MEETSAQPWRLSQKTGRSRSLSRLTFSENVSTTRLPFANRFADRLVAPNSLQDFRFRQRFGIPHVQQVHRLLLNPQSAAGCPGTSLSYRCDRKVERYADVVCPIKRQQTIHVLRRSAVPWQNERRCLQRQSSKVFVASSLRSLRRRQAFICRSSTVARPVGVSPSMTESRQAKWRFQSSSRG